MIEHEMYYWRIGVCLYLSISLQKVIQKEFIDQSICQLSRWLIIKSISQVCPLFFNLLVCPTCCPFSNSSLRVCPTFLLISLQTHSLFQLCNLMSFKSCFEIGCISLSLFDWPARAVTWNRPFQPPDASFGPNRRPVIFRPSSASFRFSLIKFDRIYSHKQIYLCAQLPAIRSSSSSFNFYCACL